MATNTQLGDLNSEQIPSVWRLRHWLSGDVKTIANDGTLPKLLEKFEAVRDGYEIDDSELSAQSAEDGD